MPWCRPTQAQCCSWRPTWLRPPPLASNSAASLADMSQQARVRVSSCCAPESKHAQQNKLLCDCHLAAAGHPSCTAACCLIEPQVAWTSGEPTKFSRICVCRWPGAWCGMPRGVLQWHHPHRSPGPASETRGRFGRHCPRQGVSHQRRSGTAHIFSSVS